MEENYNESNNNNGHPIITIILTVIITLLIINTYNQHNKIAELEERISNIEEVFNLANSIF